MQLVNSKAFRGVLPAYAIGSRVLRRTQLGMRWHLSDAVGAGMLRRRQGLRGADYLAVARER